MVDSALKLLGNALAALVGWFDTLLDKVDGAGLFIAVVFMSLAVTYIISPVLGERASDRAYERRKERRKGGEE